MKFISAQSRVSFLILGFAFVTAAGCQHKQMKSESTVVAESANGQLSQSPSSAKVILVPQWHLSPQDDTKANPRNHLPQSSNQVGIYRQLSEWTDQGTLQTVVVEGCEGEITAASPLKFNGWTAAELRELSEKDLDATLTQVGLKLKARFGDKLRVVCGDDEKLIKDQLLILSDLRGYLGFKLRISQFKKEKSDLAKRKDYIATVRELLKLRPETEDEKVVAALDEELQSKLDAYEKLIHERNGRFAAAIKREPKTNRLAVVIGSLHISDLQKQLSEAGLNSVTFRPVGLQGGEEDLIEQVRGLLKKLD